MNLNDHMQAFLFSVVFGLGVLMSHGFAAQFI